MGDQELDPKESYHGGFSGDSSKENDITNSSTSDPSRMLLDLISLQAATRTATEKARKARQGYESQREQNQVLLEYVDNLIQAVYPMSSPSNTPSKSPSSSPPSPM